MSQDGGFVWTGSFRGLGLGSLIAVLMSDDGGRVFERIFGDAGSPRVNDGGDTAEARAIKLNMLRALVYAARTDGGLGVPEKLTLLNEIRNIEFLRKNWESATSFFFEDVDPEKIARNITSPDEALWLYALSRSIIRVTSGMGRCYLEQLSQTLLIPETEKSELEWKMDLLRKKSTKDRN